LTITSVLSLYTRKTLPSFETATGNPLRNDFLRAALAAVFTAARNEEILVSGSFFILLIYRYFALPQSHYFGLGKIDKDQLVDYAKRKGMSLDEITRWLRPVLE
jgi:5-methyltetrahydrofolate--homocysteine methyltransferase